MTNENEDMISMGSADSPPGDEVGNGGAIGASIPLKKGPWTPAEDAILVDYVTKHGEGNWNAVQKHSGLARCGKSCRLRWANHLRPDLKKGAFTPEEERRITELHAKMGNKWARMATELPGRTDNEIKNYWNTRIKRRQRAGLPVYPPDICFQASNDNHHPDDMCSFPSGDIQHHDLIPVNNFEIPAVEFKKLELSRSYLDMPAGSLLDIPPSSLLDHRLNYSYNSNSLFSSMHPAKRLRASGVLLPRSGFSLNGAVSVCTQYPGDGSEIGQSFSMPSAYDHNLPPDHITSSQLLPSSHEFIHGNFPPSEPTPWAMKLELPSFQNHIGGNWGSPASPLPSLDSVDTLIQSPPTEQPGSAVLSPRNSGLLDAVLYESKAIKNSKNNHSHHTGISFSPGGLMDDTSQDVHATDWESHGDPTSPFGHSAASMFNTYTVNSVVGSSGCEVRQEALNVSTPDILPPSSCYDHQGEKNDEESLDNEIHSWGTW